MIDFVVGKSCVSDGMAFLFVFYISSVGVILLVAYILETLKNKGFSEYVLFHANKSISNNTQIFVKFDRAANLILFQ